MLLKSLLSVSLLTTCMRLSVFGLCLFEIRFSIASSCSLQNRPLTRYLPVRGDEDHFDLRAHIESSGHQLELCPHVLVTATGAKGFLSKLGGRFSNWNKRWFVFDRQTRTLSYYSDKSEKKPRGGIHFQVGTILLCREPLPILLVYILYPALHS